MSLEPPVTYQGGKGRLAKTIASHILKEKCRTGRYYDLCCGSGAVTLALVERTIEPALITMVDSGPWGWFWRRVGNERFQWEKFKDLIESMPADPREIQAFVVAMAKKPVRHLEGRFLVLQAASFGGKPVSVDGDRWVTHGFRSYWEPTATSNRRSHVNPMMPMPKTLLSRVTELSINMRYVNVQHGSVTDVVFNPGSVVYIDPPYRGLTKYARGFNLKKLIRRVLEANCVCLVSEASKVSGGEALQLSEGRKKGGISGKRGSAHEEWLTIFRPEKA